MNKSSCEDIHEVWKLVPFLFETTTEPDRIIYGIPASECDFDAHQANKFIKAQN